MKQPVHMHDQMTNKIDLIMRGDKPPLLERLEEVSVTVLLVLVFIISSQV
ncbi:conserved hypothetical protein [Candidatus Methylobacter favarea]|uniref:Uncharacterized protein n=1 Tax=Candidatus Methylobacter favarea TaxID=2707345 RepID=A0A8S0XIA4_9GAMM|nr:hypothetical protein [Candidatus Methylobacter favarea]CAA9890516.1 conserved hypothetical protein [Candidatus Methylobacter favarea]